jgi:hypothetical protein
MTEAAPEPTRLERVVGVLAKVTIALWAGGFVVLLVNSLLIHQHDLYLVALGAIRSGFVVALVIVLSIIGSVILRKIRGSGEKA